MSISLVDSHCHIPMIELDGGVQEIVDNAAKNNVDNMLCVCVDLDSFDEVLDISNRYNGIYCSVGIHPNTRLEKEVSAHELAKKAQNPRIIAIGETGLDYYRCEGDLNWQRQRFREHIRAAIEINKPIIVHCRDAKDDVLEILRQEKAEQVGGVMHCFVEDIDTAKRAIDLNFYVSFSGIVTFKNATNLQDVAKEISLSSILIETDSPYLAPVPFRGKQNQPAYVRNVAECISQLRDISLDEFASKTTQNFNRLFIK